jgi:hypothetical protein
MGAGRRWLGGRVDSTPWTLGLLAGDVAVIVAFVVVGELSHGIDPLAAAGYVVVNTLSPFLLGWFLVAIPAGLYANTDESVTRVGLRTAGAWLLADVVAQLVRMTPYIAGGNRLWAVAVFGLVSFAVGGTLLVTWRVGATLVRRRRRRSTVPA